MWAGGGQGQGLVGDEAGGHDSHTERRLRCWTVDGFKGGFLHLGWYAHCLGLPHQNATGAGTFFLVVLEARSQR